MRAHGEWESGYITALILTLDWSALRLDRLTPGEEASVTH